jgi:hypothetical protein
MSSAAQILNGTGCPPFYVSMLGIKVKELPFHLKISSHYYHLHISSQKELSQFVTQSNLWRSPIHVQQQMLINGMILTAAVLFFWLGSADAAPGLFPRSSSSLLSKRSSQLVGCDGDQETKIKTALRDMANMGLYGNSEASTSNIGYTYFISPVIDCCYNSGTPGTRITFWMMSSPFSKEP